VGKYNPNPDAEPAGITRCSSGPGTYNQPFSTLKMSGCTTVLPPAPSAEALTPHVPAAPAVPLTMIETLGSAGLSLTGVAPVNVGNAVTCVTNCTRCWPDVLLPLNPTQCRRYSRLKLGAAAGLMKTNVTTAATVVTLSATTSNSRAMIYS